MDRFTRKADDAEVRAVRWDGPDSPIPVSRVTVAPDGTVSEGWADDMKGRMTYALRTPMGWSEIRRGDWIIDGSTRCSSARFGELYVECR